MKFVFVLAFLASLSASAQLAQPAPGEVAQSAAAEVSIYTPPELPKGIRAARSSLLAPLELTPELEQTTRADLADAHLKTDAVCRHTRADLAPSEIKVDASNKSVCVGHDREVLINLTKHQLFICSQGNVIDAMKVATAKNGIGKRKEGDDKNPIGTYWLGFPHKSKYFGIFIPVGYPNFNDLLAHKGGSDVGIHGPNHFHVFHGNTCDVADNLKKDWTAGCVATGRDEQILALSNWVLANWPVKVTLALKF